MILLKQKATKAEQEQAKLKADSIYKVLLKGADFSALAKKYSDDKGSAVNGGQLPWLTKGQTVKAFEDAVFEMKKGELHTPVLSEFGYHVIKLVDKQQFFPFDSLKNDIYRKSMPKGTTKENILEQKADELASHDNNLKYLIQEYHDGLLLYEISNQLVWDKASKDERGLAAYFAKNKSKYKWEQPRFKGIAYHVKDEADIIRLIKIRSFVFV